MPNPNEAKVVQFTNIFDFDYTHAYGGVPYQLRAGVTMLLPWAIGDHLATHLARQAIIRKAPVRDANNTDGKGSDRPLWDDVAIDALKAQIIKDAYVEERTAPLSEAETYKRKVEELNKQFPGAADMGITPVVPQAPVVPPTVVTEPGAVVGSANGTAVTTAPPTTPQTTTYADKAEVIAELVKQNIPHNPRSSKANLEKLLQ